MNYELTDKIEGKDQQRNVGIERYNTTLAMKDTVKHWSKKIHWNLGHNGYNETFAMKINTKPFTIKGKIIP